MTDYQFNKAKILIQPTALAIGPFTFDLGPQLPAGTQITAHDVASSVDIDGVETDSSLLLIDSHTEVNDIISVYFNYPGAGYHGVHKLTFTYTLDTAAEDEADFWGVEVTDV